MKQELRDALERYRIACHDDSQTVLEQVAAILEQLTKILDRELKAIEGRLTKLEQRW